jgi:hypothetical protein
MNGELIFIFIFDGFLALDRRWLGLILLNEMIVDVYVFG